MNCPALSVVVFIGMAVTIASVGAPGAASMEIKSIPVPMPKGLVRAEALDIIKDWNPPIVHLKGNAKVRIYGAIKAPRGVIVLQADAVDLNQATGDIAPRGNVRLSIEETK